MKERLRSYVPVISALDAQGLRHVHCSFCCAVQRTTRTPWVRGLRLYRLPAADTTLTSACDDVFEPALDGHVHARSRFRSVRHPDRFAVYSLHESGERLVEPTMPGDHTLVVVREFRRVPLHASALGLVLFAARAGCEAQMVATLAHFAERALSRYQPPYLLLARSLEQPGIAVLVAGVQASAVMDSAGRSPFSVEHLLPEITPLLVVEPEWYAYAPEPARASLFSTVSPYAV